MDPLLDRTAERRALSSEQARLAEVEAELERIATAEQVVTRLLAEQDDGPSDAEGGQRVEHGQARRSPALAVPAGNEAAGVVDLPAEYQRLGRSWSRKGRPGRGGVMRPSGRFRCQGAA
ncbi:hypothetical protein E1264_30590 [Actinomadura sp. KC216]|uniref:hypothetical protein n=1 Tax=Actinomadura sp. KC216 TaxID=2530370 RepID=UPI00104A5181|nr:hypothetical protein [Actinomadura sp. KC216]TDB82907.1 hypothetical protein E1264_30590 [Actinomadura sp. KC216]